MRTIFQVALVAAAAVIWSATHSDAWTLGGSGGYTLYRANTDQGGPPIPVAHITDDGPQWQLQQCTDLATLQNWQAAHFPAKLHFWCEGEGGDPSQLFPYPLGLVDPGQTVTLYREGVDGETYAPTIVEFNLYGKKADNLSSCQAVANAVMVACKGFQHHGRAGVKAWCE